MKKIFVGLSLILSFGALADEIEFTRASKQEIKPIITSILGDLQENRLNFNCFYPSNGIIHDDGVSQALIIGRLKSSLRYAGNIEILIYELDNQPTINVTIKSSPKLVEEYTFHTTQDYKSITSLKFSDFTVSTEIINSGTLIKPVLSEVEVRNQYSQIQCQR